MEQVLSQAEIDALLGGISEGAIETEAPQEAAPIETKKEVKSIDFIGYTRAKRKNCLPWNLSMTDFQNHSGPPCLFSWKKK